MKLWALFAFLLVVLGVMVVLPIANEDTSSDAKMASFAIIGAVIVAGALVLTLIFGLIGVYMRGKQVSATAVRPGTTAFTTQRTPELLAVLKAIGIEQPVLGLQPVVTVGPEGIEVWGHRRAGTPRLTVPWGDIAYIHPAHFVIFNGRRRFPVLTMQVLHKGSGRLLEMPLPIIGRNGLSFARLDHANALLRDFARYTNIV